MQTAPLYFRRSEVAVGGVGPARVRRADVDLIGGVIFVGGLLRGVLGDGRSVGDAVDRRGMPAEIARGAPAILMLRRAVHRGRQPADIVEVVDMLVIGVGDENRIGDARRRHTPPEQPAKLVVTHRRHDAARVLLLDQPVGEVVAVGPVAEIGIRCG